MINQDKIYPVIEGYKKYFPKHWKNEKYKWEAVKHFQDNWDINAEDFGEMFKKSMKKVGNLIGSKFGYPITRIIQFAKADNEAVRNMFIHLYNENIELSKRINDFIQKSNDMLAQYDNGTWKKHHQSIKEVSCYLWLKFPDKYYMYKYEIYRAVANELESDYHPINRIISSNIISGYAMYDEICNILKSDSDIHEILNNALTENCYPDTNLKTLTMDFGFYLCRFYHDEKTEETSSEDKFIETNDGQFEIESLDLDVDSSTVINTWLLNWNSHVYNWEAEEEQFNYHTAISNIKNNGAFVTDWRCRTKQVKIGDRVFLIKLGQNPKGIFATGYAVSNTFESEYIGDDGLTYKANFIDICLTEFLDYHTDNLISMELLKQKFPNQQWSPQGSGISIKPNAAKWLIENFGKSENKFYETDIDGWYPTQEEYSPKLSVNDWKNLLKDKEVFDEKCIDIFIKIYELGGQCTCTELSEKYGYTPNYYNVNAFNLAKRVHKKSNCSVFTKSDGKIRWWCIPFLGKDVKENHPGVYFWKLREELAEAIKDVLINPKNEYTKESFLSDVFMSENEYDKLTALLKRKKNIILQGAPGVGKTYCAKRLAWSLMGEKNNNRVCMVQFHQSYSYEDFIMGYRPTDNGGFELEKGVFYRFCETAKNDADNEYFFIIDEINRGNLSKIFGELLMLIENDKRGSEQQINLVYGSEPFYIPENLYIIGMMNTADRSLAMIDYALRRRFSFYTMSPAFEKADENGFAEYIQNIKSPLYHSIIAKIIELNKAIKEDTSLGKGFEIGHSYFISDNINDEWVKSAVEYEIIPLIEEYWFDNEGELSKWKEKLYLAIGEPYDE